MIVDAEPVLYAVNQVIARDFHDTLATHSTSCWQYHVVCLAHHVREMLEQPEVGGLSYGDELRSDAMREDAIFGGST